MRQTGRMLNTRVVSGAAAVVAACVLTALPAAAEQPGCTLKGCESGVGVSLQKMGAREATVCVDDMCVRSKLGAEKWGKQVATIKVPLQGGAVDVRIVLYDARGRVIKRYAVRGVELTKLQPNGDSCRPTCWRADFDIRAGRLHRVT